MIIMKPCGVCGQSYHCFDIVVTSFLHMYQPSCLGQHLKTHNKCKVCNQRLHLDWWSSWGFRDLDEDLNFVAQEMGVEEGPPIEQIETECKAKCSWCPR